MPFVVLTGMVVCTDGVAFNCTVTATVPALSSTLAVCAVNCTTGGTMGLIVTVADPAAELTA